MCTKKKVMPFLAYEKRVVTSYLTKPTEPNKVRALVRLTKQQKETPKHSVSQTNCDLIGLWVLTTKI
jgi:hypothetical protein